ncbi:MATE family efflux transporter [Pleomorphomonas sp. NRK KF1]|uniref:MATE family efflux transporter n=1 Tax=Pleomorphomonas sp. NRK KF1 TaxID=2943000 RepID=UPI002043F61B|nr:MATE family efflux transporter [Pleomorphomonas sp. NRK KF1]MCM5554922.1 MATE family efflux transporter [Pleomorphomonas sp. NRK KF1]
MSEKDKTHNPYLHGSLTRVFLRTAAPIVLFMTVSGLYTVVDALLLGRLAGPKALTAVTLMFPVMMLIVALQTMVSSGMASIAAREIGAGDIRAAEGTLNAANALALVVCGGLILALVFVGQPLTRALSEGDPEIARMGLEFTAIMVVFSPFSFFLAIQGDALRSEGKVGTMAAVAIAVTLLNIVFNYILIGPFGLGVVGSAAGTVLAQLVAIGAVLFLRLSGRTRLPLYAHGTGSFLANWKKMLALGAPPSLGLLGISLSSGLIIADIQLWPTAELGATVAAYGVITRVLTFAFLPMLGITTACQSIAGNNYGAGLHDRVKATLKIAFSVAVVYGAVFESMFVFLARPLGALFVDDPQVIAEVARIMPITTATYALSIPLMVLGGYYQALGMAGSAAILNLVRTYVIGLPLLALLPMVAGELGIWIAAPVGDIAMLGVVAALLAWNARRHRLAWGIFHPRPA